MGKSLKKKALITGITGFAGSHLADLLLSEGYEVYGTVRWRSRMDNVKHIRDKIIFYEADLLDAHNVYKLMYDIRPEYVFHLAAQSFVPTSWYSPTATIEVNMVGSAHLFEAVRKANIDPVIQIASSSEEYGLVKKEEAPIKEDNPLRPLSPYAVSKIGMDYLGYQYFQSYGLKIIRTRGFNHTGPRQDEMFVCSSFAKQIAEMEKGKTEPILSVGNLDSYRDFTDVRDMVKAYLLAVQKCVPGETYNIASEKVIQISKMLDILVSKSKTKITVKQDPRRLRPSDVEYLLGDATKFKKQTGWNTEIPFEKTMQDLLDYWRERV